MVVREVVSIWKGQPGAAAAGVVIRVERAADTPMLLVEERSRPNSTSMT